MHNEARAVCGSETISMSISRGPDKETMGQLTSWNTACAAVKKREVAVHVLAQTMSITRSVKIRQLAEENIQNVTIYVRSTQTLQTHLSQ